MDVKKKSEKIFTECYFGSGGSYIAPSVSYLKVWGRILFLVINLIKKIESL
jgi:hypothetical protein